MELYCVLEHYAPAGCPRSPLPASSAYAAVLRGEAPALFSALTWDASTFGWAALARWWDLTGPTPAGAVARLDLAGRVGSQRAALSRGSERSAGRRARLSLSQP